MKFSEFELKEEIVNALEQDGITEPTEIQEKSIPLILQGKDVIGMSRTGSGKTASFGIPLLNEVKKGEGMQALVLAPTRELAVQIKEELQKWGRDLGLQVAIVHGGVALQPQVDAVKRSEITVGTPGRPLDLLQRNALDLSQLEMFVLDEADKMVDMGFIQDVTKIIDATPEYRQILLYGATLSDEIGALRDKYMQAPEVARAELNVKEDLLEQSYIDCKSHEKFSLLVHVLKEEDVNRAIVFCSTRRTCDLVWKNLKKQGIESGCIHGRLNQPKRLRIIKGFHDGKYDILVASAVAARGLDISHVSHVINYDISQDPQEYIHRIGRTARAGQSGKAITLLSERDHSNFQSVLANYDVNVDHKEKPQFKKLPFHVGKRQNDGKRRKRYAY